MAIQFTFLLFAASFFILLAVVGFIRGFNLKEKAYITNGIASLLVSLCMFLVYFGQPIVGFGLFVVGGIIGLANYKKSMAAASREAVTQQAITDLSTPFRVVELFSWSGWFKITNKWGKRNGLLFYVLFNLAFILILPVLMLVLDVASVPFVVVLSVVAVVGVLVSSVAIFNQQVLRNIDAKKVE